MFDLSCRSAVRRVSTTSCISATTRTRGRSLSPWRPASCRRCPLTSTSPSPIGSSDAMPRCVCVCVISLPQCKVGLLSHHVSNSTSTETFCLCGFSLSLRFALPQLSVCFALQCVSAGMDTLTLARYYCELSLMEMDLVPERGSLLASACLLMALVTKDLGGWVCSVCSLLALVSC